ncbi:MAG: lipase [Hormoscilla sp. GM7CHS1pb]|nr:lipase [Hormoscilla sp. GM7CHS1pb]
MRICFVGDSFVNGTGDPEYLGWTGRICAVARSWGYDITYYNLGIRRETSADILARWPAEVDRRLTPEVEGKIVFSFGVNDTTIAARKIEEAGSTRVQLADSIANTREIMLAGKARSPILMVGPPPIADREQNLRISHLSGEISSVCQQLEVPYLDAIAPLEKSAIWMEEASANDGAHPGAAGYKELAKLVQNWQGWLSWFK